MDLDHWLAAKIYDAPLERLRQHATPNLSVRTLS